MTQGRGETGMRGQLAADSPETRPVDELKSCRLGRVARDRRATLNFAIRDQQSTNYPRPYALCFFKAAIRNWEPARRVGVRRTNPQSEITKVPSV
jgi:hypothetical protein